MGENNSGAAIESPSHQKSDERCHNVLFGETGGQRPTDAGRHMGPQLLTQHLHSEGEFIYSLNQFSTRVILLPGDTYWATSGDISGCHDWGRVEIWGC